MKISVSIFWFRRDLRLEDNVGLYQALASEFPVLAVFIFDETILNKLEDKKDRRVPYDQYLGLNTAFQGLVQYIIKSFEPIVVYRPD